ncbi:MAG: hypothetical protein KJ000_21150 [Pirellulaceae bacterium]|nr:hypothetical protein [Pirellulaceae bacterium]
MKRLILGLLLLAIIGCGRSRMPYTDHSRDSAAYAKDIKELVIDHVGLAKKSREPADMIAPIINELEQIRERPTGQHHSVYEELLETARRVFDACQQGNGRPTGIDKQLDQLVALVDRLPGDVNIVYEQQ